MSVTHSPDKEVQFKKRARDEHLWRCAVRSPDWFLSYRKRESSGGSSVFQLWCAFSPFLFSQFVKHLNFTHKTSFGHLLSCVKTEPDTSGYDTLDYDNRKTKLSLLSPTLVSEQAYCCEGNEKIILTYDLF